MKTLKDGIMEYLDIRRSLGFKLYKEERELNRFVTFMESENAPYITTELALRWAKSSQNVQQSHWANLLSTVRLFAQYWKTIDTRTEIPSLGLLPYRTQRCQPYIYSDSEIKQLLKACKILWSKNGLRQWTYYAFFGLLSVTGVRHQEGVSLNREDVDLSQGILTVRKSKHGRSRLLPVHKSTLHVLQKYAHFRNKVYPKLKTPAFFISDRGRRITKWSTRHNFILLSRHIGLRKLSDSFGPRIHDLRHSFVVKTMVRWYKAGVDIEQQIPVLSAYLGHVHPSDTYWYLSGVPELLGLASKRLEKQLGGVL